jgi:hypothetical protein
MATRRAFTLAALGAMAASTVEAAAGARQQPPVCPINPPAGVAYSWLVTYVKETEAGEVEEEFEVDLLGGQSPKPIVDMIEALGAHIIDLHRETRTYGIVKQNR